MRNLSHVEIMSTTGGESILNLSPEDAVKWAGVVVGMERGYAIGSSSGYASMIPVQTQTTPSLGGVLCGIAGSMIGGVLGGVVGKTTASVILPRIA